MSVSSKLHTALAKPTLQRCCDLEKLIEETNIKELHLIFPPLVEHIFAFNNQPGWSLLQTSKSRHFHDYSAIYAFLAPHGALFRLIYKLLCDEYLRYEFSLSCLPHPTRLRFEEGSVPGMYRNKIQMVFPGQIHNSLWINAFDFYLFHFSFYITNQSACKMSSGDAPSENLYFSLLESYLEQFLPLRGRDVPPVPHQPAPVRGPILHHAHSHTAIRSPSTFRLNTSLHDLGSPSRYPGLFRAGSPHPGAGPQFPGPGGLGTPGGLGGPGHLGGDDASLQDNWRTESLIQIFVEFWLNKNTISEPQLSLNSSPLKRDRNVISSLLQDQFMPSVDHVRCVRMLTKHLHYFTNSLQPSLYHTVTTTTLDDIKRSVWPCYVQKRLYVFLKHGFQKWPLDASFRMMLETWLSYVQPWRYLDPTQAERDEHTDDRLVLGHRWNAFIQDNLLFYSELLHDFLTRICRTDLTSGKNAFMLYRVAKIYGATDLSEMVGRAEFELLDPLPRSPANRSHTDLGGSYLGAPGSFLGPPGGAPESLIMTLQSSEVENASFVYRALFSERTNQQVEQLLRVIAQARMNLTGRRTNVFDTESGQSLLAWLGLSPVHDYNLSRRDDVTDPRKTIVHLDQAVALLKRIFNIADGRVTELNESCQSDRSASESLNQPSKLLPPDHVNTSNGPMLTPLGRYQVLNGLRRFAVLESGDPELRPIASYENATLVRWFYRLATWINTQASDQIENLYGKQTFASRMLQHVLLPPHTPPQPAPSPGAKPPSPRQPLTATQRHLASRPRVSLRPLASYRTLACLALAYTAVRVTLGAGPLAFTVILALALLLWAACKAHFSKVKVQ